ncbi:MAG: aspartate 1-decarboxylase [bacterium]|jgi:aspartate 1-decarboxylase|nr:aspartate 1-decarboxylase [candidate division KSB1 bacterium]MDH7558997.1 aspartate 1-decarboxylase [bacterium]
MFREMCKSKVHRARITDANLNYEGSLTIDRLLMEAADLLPNEKVHVLNLNNGTRAETYVIEGEPGSGVVCANGALARNTHPGDLVILLSFAWVPEEEVGTFRTKIVHVDERNRVVEPAKASRK